MTIEQINLVLSIPFASSQALLDFYRKELPGRVGNYRLDEVCLLYTSPSPRD